MTQSRQQFVGQITEPGLKPRNINLVVDKRPNLTSEESAAGLLWVDNRYEPQDTRRYGALIDGTTDDIQAYTNGFLAYDTLYMPEGTSSIASDLQLAANKSLIGQNWRSSILSLSGVGTSLLMNDHTTLEDMKVVGADTNTNGVHCAATASRWLIQRVNIGNCVNGLTLENTWIGSVIDCLIRDCTDAIHVGNSLNGDGPVNAIRIVGGEIAASTYGIHFDNDSNGNTSINAFTVREMAIEPSGTYGVWIESQSIGSLAFRDVYWEDCGAACLRQDVGAQCIAVEGGLMDIGASSGGASTDAGVEITGGITDSFIFDGVEVDRRSGSTATDAIRIDSGTTVRMTIKQGTRGDGALVVNNNSTTAGTAITYERSDFTSGQSKYPSVLSIGAGSRNNSNQWIQADTILSGNTTLAVTITTEPDADYEVDCFDFAHDMGGYWITSKTTTGFTFNVNTAPGGNSEFHYMIVRR